MAWQDLGKKFAQAADKYSTSLEKSLSSSVKKHDENALDDVCGFTFDAFYFITKTFNDVEC